MSQPNPRSVLQAVATQAAPPEAEAVSAEVKFAEAQQFLEDNLFADVYFRKLAEVGCTPATEAEAAELWRIGQMVRADRAQRRQRASEGNVLKLQKVAQDLQQSLGQPQFRTDDRLVREAAALSDLPVMQQVTQIIHESMARAA